VNSQCAAEDDEDGEGEVGEVDVAVGFGADGEPSEAAEPGVGAFDDPAVAGEWVAGAGDAFAPACAWSGGLVGEEWIACPAAFADLGCDAAGAELVAEGIAAVAAISPDLARLVAEIGERVDERQQVRAFVFVAGADPDLQRPALGVYDEVILAGRKASVDRARPDQVAPFFASTVDASTTTRDQSSRPLWSSSETRSVSACGQTPLSIHSCSRRRHVSPLGKPSSRGKSTYRIPV
jgi:hypothetical protein